MLRMRFLLFLFAASCATTTARSPAAPPVETVRSPNPSHFDAAALADLDRVIEAAIAGAKTPGGVLWIEHDGHHIVKSYGSRATVPAVERATDDTIYDAASITKVAATTPAILKLVDRGQIAIDDPIVRFIPEFTGDWKNEVTVRHLLTHTSGLRPGISLSPPARNWFSVPDTSFATATSTSFFSAKSSDASAACPSTSSRDAKSSRL
jgi:CubicO group peptidase (beta-lactamase class C family)